MFSALDNKNSKTAAPEINLWLLTLQKSDRKRQQASKKKPTQRYLWVSAIPLNHWPRLRTEAPQAYRAEPATHTHTHTSAHKQPGTFTFICMQILSVSLHQFPCSKQKHWLKAQCPQPQPLAPSPAQTLNLPYTHKEWVYVMEKRGLWIQTIWKSNLLVVAKDLSIREPQGLKEDKQKQHWGIDSVRTERKW